MRSRRTCGQGIGSCMIDVGRKKLPYLENISGAGS